MSRKGLGRKLMNFSRKGFLLGFFSAQGYYPYGITRGGWQYDDHFTPHLLGTPRMAGNG